nr:S8 family serine peptidase [Halovivax cerinus]
MADDEADTTGHGSDVLEILGYFAPRATFEVYRVIARNGRTRRSSLAQAIADAADDGVDVLNLSVGLYHSHEPANTCNGNCTVATESKYAAKNGTTIVAAAGNRDGESVKGVYCPAVNDSAIGVGGLVSRCRSNVVDTPESGQYWIRNPTVEGPFCGQRGCDVSASCQENRLEQPWRGNVSFHNGEPDTLAPVHYPAGDAREPLLQKGTSFATPIVSGVLASIFGDLLEVGRDPDPQTVRRAVRHSAREIDEGRIGKFDAERTWTHLESESAPGD